MKKNILAMLIMVSVAGIAAAQTTTVRGFTAGGATEGGSYGVFGQAFGAMVVDNGYEMSVGVAQMQLERDTVYAVVGYESDYSDNGFGLTGQTESHKDSLYLVNGAEYNYDLIRTLYLIVCPEAVEADGVSYPTVAVSGYCWTRENLRADLPGAMSYPGAPEVYGKLYTWETALDGVTPDGENLVQGICPSDENVPEDGWGVWYIPNAAEYSALRANAAAALRSTEGWTVGGVNSNSTGFTEYPAGEYSAVMDRYQNLGTYADFWTTVSTREGVATSLQMNYYCDTPMQVERDANDAISVRCVMENKWHELDGQVGTVGRR